MGIDNVNVHLHAHLEVSIHAPTRGATRTISVKVRNFLFQSTLPHGERPSASWTCITTTSFNPRSHTGSDFHIFALVETNKQFQSTLPHGERLPCWCSWVHISMFQSTLPHGERLSKIAIISPGMCFNPRSHTGSDR